ncbi:MAG: inorganic pyrophosphatase [Flavobacteriia bacterium]|nr:inorganic pyrophosphatase [Flavobacteriia bacterium]
MYEVYVFIEISKNSNVKYEYDKHINQLAIDRIINGYCYPQAYGFIPNTLADDDDELDMILISKKDYARGSLVYATIVGIILMEDEHGIDHKIVVTPCDEDKNIPDQNIDDLLCFFSNYKKHDSNKWSRVYGYQNAETAVKYYKECIQKYIDEQF